MTVAARLCVLITIALSLPLLQFVQSSVLALEQGNEAAVVNEHQYRVAWCRSPTATKSQGRRHAVDPSFELQLQSLAETQ